MHKLKKQQNIHQVTKFETLSDTSNILFTGPVKIKFKPISYHMNALLVQRKRINKDAYE